jgi:hypothetical protein
MCFIQGGAGLNYESAQHFINIVVRIIADIQPVPARSLSPVGMIRGNVLKELSLIGVMLAG